MALSENERVGDLATKPGHLFGHLLSRKGRYVFAYCLLLLHRKPCMCCSFWPVRLLILRLQLTAVANAAWMYVRLKEKLDLDP
jgi:hypothetical protein